MDAGLESDIQKRLLFMALRSLPPPLSLSFSVSFLFVLRLLLSASPVLAFYPPIHLFNCFSLIDFHLCSPFLFPFFIFYSSLTVLYRAIFFLPLLFLLCFSSTAAPPTFISHSFLSPSRPSHRSPSHLPPHYVSTRLPPAINPTYFPHSVHLLCSCRSSPTPGCPLTSLPSSPLPFTSLSL